jgi:transcriptional regulator with XRE-family HTH domain
VNIAKQETSMFSQKLQQLRVNAGLSQDELARRVGVKMETIQDWETGGGEPGSGARSKLAQALGVPQEDLEKGIAESQQARAEGVVSTPRRNPGRPPRNHNGGGKRGRMYFPQQEKQMRPFNGPLLADWHKRRNLLILSFPGINVVSAADFAGEIGPMEHYANAKAITGRAGLRPSRYQSDQDQGSKSPPRTLFFSFFSQNLAAHQNVEIISPLSGSSASV